MKNIREINQEFQKLKVQYNFTIGESSFYVSQKIKKSMISSIRKSTFRYTSYLGLDELREKIKEIHQGFQKENILITAGSTSGIYASIKALVTRDETILVFTPCYPLYIQVIEQSNINLLPFPLNPKDYSIDFQQLEKTLNDYKIKMMIFNNPLNPSMKVFKNEILDKLSSLAHKYNFYLLCDYCYANLTYEYNLKINNDPKVIYCYSFSKELSVTGLRLGYTLAEPKLINAIGQYQQLYLVSIFDVPQTAVIPFIPYDCSKQIKHYKKLNYYVYNSLVSMGFSVFKPEAGFYIYPDISFLGISSDYFIEYLAKKKKIGLVPSSCFLDHSHVRITINQNKQTLRKALLLIQEAIDELKQKDKI